MNQQLIRSIALVALIGCQPMQSEAQVKLGAETPAIPVYNRAEWGGWIDADKDCQNTRQEVLLLETEIPVTYVDDTWCKIATGRWRDPYTGEVYTDPSQLEIDHVVSLKEAHDAGGFKWTREQKRAFANDLNESGHLSAVGISVNRSKGARGPGQWMPPNEAFHCEYLKARLYILAKYQLVYDCPIYLSLLVEKCR